MFIRWLYFKLSFLFANYFGKQVPCVRIFRVLELKLIKGIKIYT